jgi:hypothetical protein
LIAWSRGDSLKLVHEQAGLPVLGPGGYRSFQIQTHYSNPGLLTGKVDYSGVRLHHTKVLRPHDAGVIQAGDASVREDGRVIPHGWMKYTFRCDGMTAHFTDEEVTVFSHTMHMHSHGQRLEVRVIRGDTVVRKDTTEVWDFEQSASPEPLAVDGPWTLRKGDVIEIDCYFYISDHVIFGYGTVDEMCNNRLWHFPKQPLLPYLGYCVLSGPIGHGEPGRLVNVEKLGSLKDTGRRFGEAGMCKPSPLPLPASTQST